MSLINTSAFQSDLLPGLVKKWFGDANKDYAPLYSQMMAVESSDQAFDVDATYTGFGTLQRKAQGNALTYDTASQAYTPRYLHLTYALGFAITKEMVRDGVAFKNAKKFTEGLARGARLTKEIVAASVINNAGTAGYTMSGGDGVILASASHPTRAGLQSNILASAADLSEAAIEAMLVQIRQAKDNRGNRINLMIDKLIVDPTQEATANRILFSEKRVATADNDMNFIKANSIIPGGIVVNPYLTSTTQWQVTTSCPDGLKFKVRQDAEMDTDNDFNTKNGLYSVDMRISAGWSDFRGLYISL